MDYFDTGFTVREASWHGKEVLLAEAPETWDEARMAAGLMWEPRLVPLYHAMWERDDEDSLVPLADGSHPEGHDKEWHDGAWWERRFERHEGGQRVERDDTGGDLGTVSGTFELITHAEMGTIMEPVLAQTGVQLDTMGSVREGRQVYATVLLDEPYQIKNDVDGFGDPVLTLPYFAILNSHDGTGACKGLYTQVRVVCANTVQAAAMDGDRTGAQFSLRHTSGVKARIADARDVIDGARVEASRWREMAEALSLISVTHDQQQQYLDEFIPRPPIGITSDRVQANIANERAKFMTILNESATNAGVSASAYGLVAASVEYLDHVRGFRNRDTLMGRQILSAEPLKAKAFQLARELVGAS